MSRGFFESSEFARGSVAMQSLFALVERVAPMDTPLLIVGEPGTRKDALASAVHQASARRDAPFVTVDCRRPDGDSLEVDLFGDERSACTGSGSVEQGAFEAASGGSVFLAEVGALSHDLQFKIVRAMEKREVRRVGGTRWLPVNVRIIAATTGNLQHDLNKKRIRADFYYLLTTVELRLPPLRERLEDIPALVKIIVDELGLVEKADAEALLDPKFLNSLREYSWPGNVRQLRRYIERCVALGDLNLPPSVDTIPSATSGMFRVGKPMRSSKPFANRV
jgi:two-component system, NtrC family, response regulator GlrR